MESSSSKFTAVLCYLLAFGWAIGVDSAVDWSDVRGLLSGGAETFHSIARPLSNFTELTYLTTSGGSYQEGHEERASDGWVKDRDLSKDKPNGGMRGLVFVTEEPGPVAVVFRGSDVTMKSRGSLLDICFDASLVGGDEKSTPPFCGNFTAKDIDYIQQAESLMKKTMTKYPKRQVVTSGHSTGCALAAAMAVKLKSEGVTAVCFSLPGVIEEVAKRAEMKRKDIVDSDNVFSLAISEDPILLAGVMAQSLFGKLFVWKSYELEECTGCCENSRRSTLMDVVLNANCTSCYQRVHTFINYEIKVFGNKIPQEVEIPGAVEDCSDLFPKNIVSKESRLTTLDHFLSKRMGGLGMGILLVVICFTAICSVSAAAISLLSKSNKRTAKFMELESRA